MSKIPKSGRLLTGLAALRERNYLLYVTGHFTSQLGSWIELTAVSWILYEMTNSPVLLGLSGLFRAAPMILFALLGGAVADRLPRRLLLLLTESTMLATSLLMGTLAFTGHLEYWHLYLLSLVNGTLSAFSVPARHALFAGLVPRSAMQSAVTLNAVAVRSGAFLGPTVAGLALAFGSYALPFFINAASFLGMLLALLALRIPPAQAHASTRRVGLWQGMAEGVHFVWRSRLLQLVLGLEIVSGLFGHNTTIITVLARDLLRAGPEGLGLLLSALGAGGLLGMSVMVVFRVEQHARLILIMGGIYALLFTAFGLSPWLGLSAVLLFALGAVDGVWSVTRNTLAHLLVTDALRGRVMSVVTLVTRGSAPLGRVQSGFLAALAGGPAAALIGAAVVGAAILASWRVHLPDAIGPPVPPDTETDASP